tara:strand:- start:1817 stop:2086 length:270 start_codon:yes stop_codon:yes gene_type:complete
MPILEFRHPKTGEIFEEIVPFSHGNKPFVLEDGTECELVPFYESKKGPCLVNKNAEVWEKDSAWIKKCNPKYVRTQSGHKVRYDSTKHC